MNDLKTGAVGSLCFLRYQAVHKQHSWQSINLPNTPYANLQKLEQRIVQRGGYVRYASIQVSITQISLEPCHGGTDRVPVVDVITKFRSCHAKDRIERGKSRTMGSLCRGNASIPTFLNIEV